MVHRVYFVLAHTTRTEVQIYMSCQNTHPLHEQTCKYLLIQIINIFLTTSLLLLETKIKYWISDMNSVKNWNESWRKKLTCFFPFETCNLDGVKSSPNCIDGSCACPIPCINPLLWVDYSPDTYVSRLCSVTQLLVLVTRHQPNFWKKGPAYTIYLPSDHLFSPWPTHLYI